MEQLFIGAVSLLSPK